VAPAPGLAAHGDAARAPATPGHPQATGPGVLLPGLYTAVKQCWPMLYDKFLCTHLLCKNLSNKQTHTKKAYLTFERCMLFLGHTRLWSYDVCLRVLLFITGLLFKT
jgi:hypothetical protein